MFSLLGGQSVVGRGRPVGGHLAAAPSPAGRPLSLGVALLFEPRAGRAAPAARARLVERAHGIDGPRERGHQAALPSLEHRSDIVRRVNSSPKDAGTVSFKLARDDVNKSSVFLIT